MDLLSVLVVGLTQLPWGSYVIVVLLCTHPTIFAVTVFLHRNQAHRAIELHPIVSIPCRIILWMKTGMFSKVWAAIHRKHHAKVETINDPHSPRILGIEKVLLEGAELYRNTDKSPEMLDRYGHGTVDDWLERNIFGVHDRIGVGLTLVIYILIFGPIGLTLWAIEMMWIPLFAAGIVNGFGHYRCLRCLWFYRNTETKDDSQNILPWGILIGGEELHNNHHAFPTSAKLSLKWWEFDIGWAYIRIFEMFGLARVKYIHGRKVATWKRVYKLEHFFLPLMEYTYEEEVSKSNW